MKIYRGGTVKWDYKNNRFYEDETVNLTGRLDGKFFNLLGIQYLGFPGNTIPIVDAISNPTQKPRLFNLSIEDALFRLTNLNDIEQIYDILRQMDSQRINESSTYDINTPKANTHIYMGAHTAYLKQLVNKFLRPNVKNLKSNPDSSNLINIYKNRLIARQSLRSRRRSPSPRRSRRRSPSPRRSRKRSPSPRRSRSPKRTRRRTPSLG